MSDRFDVEQGILSCWQVTDDIDLLYKNVMESDITTDEIANFLLGLKTIYNAKFDRLFDDFCDSLATEFNKCRELKEQLGAKQAEIDRLMLEFCPQEMTEQQLETWKRNQMPIDFIG